MQRWIALIGGVVLQMVLGGIYAWSAFTGHLTEDHGLSKVQCGLIFGGMIAVFTLAMLLAGRVLARWGPRKTAGLGAVLFGAGYVMASFSGGQFWLLLVSLSGVTGAGIGFGYVCPLSVGMKWFPRNRGLVSGVAVAGFGGGAIVLSWLADGLMVGGGMDVLGVFRVVGLVLGAVAFVGAMGLSEPKHAGEATGKAPAHLRAPFSSRPFRLICLGMFAGTFAGLLTIGNLSPLMEKLGVEHALATWSISLFAVGNAVGRIAWGQVHDRLGSRWTIPLSLACLGLGLLLLLLHLSPAVLLPVVFLVGAGFGACFVVYASSLAEYFGVEQFARLYPVCFLGYGLAGLTGPPMGGWFADATGSYRLAVLLSVALVGLATLWIGFRLRTRPQAV